MTKRGREGDLDALTTIANYFVLLSRGGQCATTGRPISRVFECKTCNRQFPSFQALGGHRASHKRSRVMAGGELNHHHVEKSPEKPKAHECPICGAEFGLGQALGGHMRRHRVAADHEKDPMDQLSLLPPPPRVSTVLKKSSSSSHRRRELWLDLNLSPGENGFDFQIEKVAAPPPPPMLHCYL